MKAALSLSALFMLFTVACGAAQYDQAQTSEGTSAMLAAPRNGPITCSIQTVNGNYLTAVGGGGRITDVMHSDARQINAWEHLRINALGGGWFSIQTYTGNYLTAVGGGGRTVDVIHSDATRVQAWEKFKFSCVSGG